MPSRAALVRLLLFFSCAAASAAAGADRSYGVRCGAGDEISIAVGGDIIIQPELEARARAGGTPYRSFWQAIEPVIGAADIAYANLEGPVAVDEADARTVPASVNAVSSMPQALSFNYGASLIVDLKAAGFDVVSTANNHALDRGSVGADLTIDRLERGGLAFTGTRKRSSKGLWSTLTRARGFTVAWLACTYGTNGIPDLRRQVLYCFKDRQEVLSEIARLHDDASVDAVILVPHWGIENSTVIEQRQRDLARSAIEAGALAVVGTHSHVLQRWERVVASDGREGLVIYSTGNLVSAQTAPNQRIGIIGILELAKGRGSVKAQLSAASYVLTQIADHSGIVSVREADPSAAVSALPAHDRVRMSELKRTCGER